MKNYQSSGDVNRKKWLSGLTLGILLMGIMPVSPVLTRAAAVPGAVVFNEVAWAGSADSANDEWIELYNPNAVAVDLAGWKIRDDGADAFTFPAAASIAAHSYLLLEDRESAVADVTADYIYNLSLANSGDSLQLVDEVGGVIDMVNGSGGAWYAGAVSGYASMERKDAAVGDLAANFASSTGGSGAHGAAGTAIMGTPKAANSVISAGGSGDSGAVSTSNQITASFVSSNWQLGQTVKLVVTAEKVSEMFAYGYELDYDPALLQFQNVAGGGFLSNSGVDDTSLQSGLIGAVPGKLLVAEARTADPKTGVSGSGVLFEVNFLVKALPVSNTLVSFANSSFSSSPSGDLVLTYAPASWTAPTVIAPVTGLTVTEGNSRYQIKLSWVASASSADHYRVERKDAHGQWVILGNVTALEFIDQEGIPGGGKIIPKLVYSYRVSALKSGLQSSTLEISAQDSRGIKADNNRSDLVDGRDLERLALHFAENDQFAGFDPLVDTTYDGMINGSDLIDLGADFAKKY